MLILRKKSLLLFSSFLLFVGCNDTTFRGGPAKTGTPPAPKCVEGTEQTGIDVILLVDNSGSLASDEIDCQDTNKLDRIYTCGGTTQRETAIRNLTEMLNRKTKELPDEEFRMSIVSYPGEGSNYIDKQNAKTVISWELVDDNFNPDLEFVNRPGGYTPFNHAIDQAGSLAKESTSGNPLVIVNISDGHSTSLNTYTAKEIHENEDFPEYTKFVTFQLTQKARQLELRKKHAVILNRFNQNGEVFSDEQIQTITGIKRTEEKDPNTGDIVSKFETIVSEGLAKEVARDGYYEVSPTELSAGIEALVEKTIKCE